MEASVAVIGLGRVGLPLALSFADRGLRTIGVERQQAVLDQLAARQMPFSETGTQELLGRVMESGQLELTRSVQDAASADHIVLTLHTPSHVHIEIDISHVRGVIDDLLPVLREGHSLILRSTVAPGTTEWVAGYIEQRRGFQRRREPVRLARAGAHRREPLPGGDRDAALRRRRRRRELGLEGGRAVRDVRHRDRPDHAGAGGAGEDLDQHPALHAVRPAEPPDDGVRAVRGERLRRDRPDQPRLPARRDGGAGADGGRLPAQGLHLLRGALERAGDAARRVAGARDGAAVHRQGAEVAPGRLAARPEGRRARPHLQARLRRHARLARLQARPHARARAGSRGAPRPARARRLGAARLGARGRGRRRRGHQPLGLRGPARPAARGHAARRPVERDGRGLACSTSCTRESRRSDAGPRHGRRRHDRRRGREAPAARRRLGGARVGPARGAGVDGVELRDPPRRPEAGRAKRAARCRAART